MALQKYEPVVLCRGGDAEMAPSPSGEYVRLEEVVRLIHETIATPAYRFTKDGASAGVAWTAALHNLRDRLAGLADTPKED